MRKKESKVIIAPKVINMTNSETFVVTKEGKTFCMVYRFVGIPPIKDCMDDYNRGQKYVR